MGWDAATGEFRPCESQRTGTYEVSTPVCAFRFQSCPSDCRGGCSGPPPVDVSLEANGQCHRRIFDTGLTVAGYCRTDRLLPANRVGVRPDFNDGAFAEPASGAVCGLAGTIDERTELTKPRFQGASPCASSQRLRLAPPHTESVVSGLG